MKMAIIKSTQRLSSFFLFLGVDLLDVLELVVRPDKEDGLDVVVELEMEMHRLVEAVRRGVDGRSFPLAAEGAAADHQLAVVRAVVVRMEPVFADPVGVLHIAVALHEAAQERFLRLHRIPV